MARRPRTPSPTKSGPSVDNVRDESARQLVRRLLARPIQVLATALVFAVLSGLGLVLVGSLAATLGLRLPNVIEPVPAAHLLPEETKKDDSPTPSLVFRTLTFKSATGRGSNNEAPYDVYVRFVNSSGAPVGECSLAGTVEVDHNGVASLVGCVVRVPDNAASFKVQIGKGQAVSCRLADGSSTPLSGLRDAGKKLTLTTLVYDLA